MKYGLITYKDTENIGDDIQSYVAIRFLPKIDYYIEREELDLFVPSKKEQVVTIMNGWFLHSKINFPPSPYIYPIYVSTHLSSYNSGGIRTEYINDYTKKSLMKYGPIGCRDSSTVNLLTENDVDNYFSGCLTLTIQKDKNIKKKDYICIVDISEESELYLKEKFNDTEIVKKTHTLDREENSKLSYEERFANVKKLLDVYQEAKLVITSRLHCALPCLALGTPVILLYDENKLYTKDRLKDYADIVTHMSTDEFLQHGYEVIEKGVINPKDYLKIRDKVENIVKDKLNNCKLDNETLPSVKNYNELYIKPKRKIDFLYKTAVLDMDTRKRDYINLQYDRDYWKKEFDILLAKYDPSAAAAIEYWKKEFYTLLEKYEKVNQELELLQKKKHRWKIKR